ncbi:hypothetical protein J9303_07930 [Bacillaceae bacterium Marseille-Q3522]|nr:hypothetical protein [Bacillaceae bacterium Marseille-Q3522]
MFFLSDDTEKEENVITAFRASGLNTEDLEIVTWSRRFAKNLYGLSELLGEK